MKKLILNIIGLVSLFSLTSCDEWLQVSPETEVTQEDLLTTEAGFTDALTGAYIEMKADASYGNNLSMNFIEHLASSWDVEAASWEEQLGQFNYGNATVEGMIEGTFRHQYFTIASLNAILSSIDDKKDIFYTDGMYEQIKGECLAMRAYIHFDLLRLFGPVPGTESSDLVLPYVTTLSKESMPYSTYGEFKTALLADMDEAQQLLATAEPYGNWASYRSIRMNEEAVRAMQARAYLWFGDKEQAFDLASGIVASTTKTLGTGTDFTNSDFGLTKEQIFGLHLYDLYTLYQDRFTDQVLKHGTNSLIVNTNLYGNTGTDIREAQLWEQLIAPNAAQAYTIKKYKVSSDVPLSFSVDYRRIPLIRLSEMYLIATEAAPDLATAQTYWDTFKNSRNLTAVALPEDETAFKSELVKEYRKEFFAEGQAFYAYKRLNVGEEDFLWLPTGATINYVVPLPQGEIVQN